MLGFDLTINQVNVGTLIFMGTVVIAIVVAFLIGRLRDR